MAIKYTIAKHHVCFPSKVLSGQVGHVYNMVTTEDTDNGTICSRGDYVSFDQYKVAAAPSTYAGVIREQAADGNWYVEVTTVDPQKEAILICEVENIPQSSFGADFANLANFYNAKGKTVRGYSLAIGDIYELSEDAFTGKPSAGKAVTVSAQKHVVAVASE